MDLTLQLANTQGLIPAVRTSTARSVLANAKAQLLMALQDEDVGAVLGKKGQTLTQIQQVGIAGMAWGIVHDLGVLQWAEQCRAVWSDLAHIKRGQ